MTANQIAYWNMRETSRANRARETENTRHNMRTEGQTDLQLQEMGRHNLETEKIGWGNLSETSTHNRAMEYLGLGTLNESIRHNKANEYLSKYATDTQASTSRYVANTSAAATRYAADRGYAANIYGAQMSAAASKYSADQSAASSRYATTSKWITDTANRTANVAMNQARIESNNRNTVISSVPNYINSISNAANRVVSWFK